VMRSMKPIAMSSLLIGAMLLGSLGCSSVTHSSEVAKGTGEVAAIWKV